MNNMKKLQSKIAVDVVLLPPDDVIDKAIEVNQAQIKHLSKPLIINLSFSEAFEYIRFAHKFCKNRTDQQNNVLQYGID